MCFDIWKEFDKHCKDIKLQQFMSFETSLLGNVSFILKDGKYVSVIPEDMQEKANKHGYCILSADYQKGYYTLQLLKKLGKK